MSLYTVWFNCRIDTSSKFFIKSLLILMPETFSFSYSKDLPCSTSEYVHADLNHEKTNNFGTISFTSLSFRNTARSYAYWLINFNSRLFFPMPNIWRTFITRSWTKLKIYQTTDDCIQIMQIVLPKMLDFYRNGLPFINTSYRPNQVDQELL